MKTIKLTSMVLIALIILATALIIYLKPQIHKVVKIDKADVAVEEKNLDTNTEEDKVVWNGWHSDLTNKIMQNVNISQAEEPLNTINMVQFNVDSNGNISNIKISAEPEKYTKSAQKIFFDVINNLNGDQILKFPKNSNRKMVTYKSDFITDTKMHYTQPEDYSDYETIKR